LGLIRNLALLGRNRGERCDLFDHLLATAMWADSSARFEISDMKNLGKFFVAVLAEKNVLRHSRSLLDVSSLPTW
jgi:hypothetical protein